jgi:hypothetical protein
MDREQVIAIVRQYEKHGWTLRRLLLSDLPYHRSSELGFVDVPVVKFEIDAAWFSRSSVPGREAWELRTLGEPPFAVLDVIEANDSDAVKEEKLARTEQKLLASRRQEI